MLEQLISVGFGKETFSTCSASLSAFIVTAPFDRVLPSKRFRRQGQLQRFPVSHHPEVNGYLYLDSVGQVPEGTVILMQASHRYRATPLRDGAMFVALRSTGPLLAIKANLPSAHESTLTGDFLVFQGRGDILNKEELKARGIHVPKNYVNGFMAPDEVAECYTISTLSPATSDKPAYEATKDRDGETVLVQRRPGRKLSLRRST